VLLKPVTPSVLHDHLVEVVGTEVQVLPDAMGGVALEQQLRQRHAGARVLLAEDNHVNQEVARELLRAAGLCVEVADNGAIALRMLSEQRYDLVLMDMQMPEMDGLQATRAIRTLPHCLNLPILAMTANAFGDDRRACHDVGMDDHLGKPVEPAVLYAALLRWLPGRFR
jgi:CheY-like chemotaxis protein